MSYDSIRQCWVIKIGGRLLSLPDLSERIRFLIGKTAKKPLLVVGGGAAADLVREWDRIHHLNPFDSHWLAIQAMGLNERLLETLVPDTIGVTCLHEAEAAWQNQRIPILRAYEFLKSNEQSPDRLPTSWDVTSDSIAAYAAFKFSAAGLLLLKSIDGPESIDCPETLQEPFVDGYFSRLARNLPAIAWCNLRSDPLQITSASGKSQGDLPDAENQI